VKVDHIQLMSLTAWKLSPEPFYTFFQVAMIVDRSGCSIAQTLIHLIFLSFGLYEGKIECNESWFINEI